MRTIETDYASYCQQSVTINARTIWGAGTRQSITAERTIELCIDFIKTRVNSVATRKTTENLLHQYVRQNWKKATIKSPYGFLPIPLIFMLLSPIISWAIKRFLDYLFPKAIASDGDNQELFQFK